MTAPPSLRGRRVLIVGLGDVGGHLAAGLARAGAQVTGVRRGPSAPPGVALVRADVTDAESLATVPRDPELLVVCLTPDAYDEAGYRRTFLAGARNIAAHCPGPTTRAVLWVSSTAVHAQGGGVRVTDADATEPASFRGRVLLESERALAAAGAPTTAVRFAGIYGPNRLALVARALRGRGAPPEPVHWTNRIHRDDAVAVLEHLLARAVAGEPPWPAVLASDGQPAPRHEVLRFLAARLGVPLREEDGGPDRAPSRRLIPERLFSSGFHPRYPDYRSGFEQVLADARASGALEALRERISREGA